MSTYKVKHLHTGEEPSRPRVLLNDQQDRIQRPIVDSAVEKFHRQLPYYGETKLHSLPSVAAGLGVGHVFVKDESTRFDLPSFKILGASWAMHRAICEKLGVPPSTSLEDLKQKLASQQGAVRLVTCSDGNWGRALSRMARYLEVLAKVYLPGFVNQYTQDLIRGEGAEVEVLKDGSYDQAVEAVKRDAETTGSLMVMDISWEGFEKTAEWVTEGYETMLQETDRQVAALTNGKRPSLVIGSVGAGSWMHAVTLHYRPQDENVKVVTVEADTAACFKESLHCGQLTSLETGDTIMCGMNCGTLSLSAWPILRAGTFAAVTVNDKESHECVLELQKAGIDAGPCGAATLAALRRICKEIKLDGRDEMVVVLFSTEGNREYEIPE